MKRHLLLTGAVLFYIFSYGQECSNCNKTPKVVSYDMEVLVPKPPPGDSLNKWYQLFFVSKFANAKLFELNKHCVRFMQPFVQNKEGRNVLMVGVTDPALPKNSTPSKYGDYLVTGTIYQLDKGYRMQLKLLTACEGVVVDEVSASFDLTIDANHVKQVAENAAIQLSSLGEKINEFAKEQRDKNKNVAFANWSSASITVVPKKRNLAEGQETEVQLTMKDCDGTPLADRTIDFTKNSIGGMPILGTTGGTITPSSVTTDASGKAKVKFKMGSGRTAMIAAHYKFNRPYGCPDAMVGSAPINGVPIKVFVQYEIDNDVTFKPKVDLGGVKSEGGEEHSMFYRNYSAYFYHYPSKTPENMLLFISPEDKFGLNNVYEVEDGYFMYSKIQKQMVMKGYIADRKVLEELHEKASTESNFGRVIPKHTTTFAVFKANGLDRMSFNITFRFENEGDEHEIGTGVFPSGISVSEGDDGVVVRTTQLKDDDSPYKTQYVVYVDRKIVDTEGVDKMLGTNFTQMFKSMDYENVGRERMTLRILTPY